MRNWLIIILTIAIQASWLSSAMAQEISTPLQPQCLTTIGAHQLTDAHPELTGKTVSLALVELAQPSTGDPNAYAFTPNFQHNALAAINPRGLYYYHNPYRPMQYSDHASVIAGILWGNDKTAESQTLADFQYRGMAPALTVDVYETNWFLYKRILTDQPEPIDTDIISISWGTDADDAITRWWQRGIDTLAARDDCLVVAGCGNGIDDFNSISKPSSSYNVISVGAAGSLGDYPDSLRYVGPPVLRYSSFGPTEDGRCKPDIIAPGNCLGPATTDPNTYISTKDPIGYSSFATPQVAGAAALLIDAARQGNLTDADDPRVIKALLLSGANKLLGWHKGMCPADDDHETPLDYQQGAGLLNVENSYQYLIAGRYQQAVTDPNSAASLPAGWDLAQISLDPNDPNSQRIYLLPQPLKADTYFTATLCWYRHYQPGRFFQPEELNFLALELWSLDQQGNLLALLDHSSSTYDNLQHIYYHCPQTQRIALVINADDNPQSARPAEVYGLAYGSRTQNWQGDKLAGDIDADGRVGPSDLIRLLWAWWQYSNIDSPHAQQYIPEDLNADGLVNNDDMKILSAQWQLRSPWRADDPNDTESPGEPDELPSL